MVDNGIRQGTATWAKPLIATQDLVYVHTDIEEVEMEDGITLYQYHEVTYTPLEYIQVLVAQSEQANSTIDELQDAITELYEMQA